MARAIRRAPRRRETESLADLEARLEPYIQVLKPEGTGPFPVVVQMHGCGGVMPMQVQYAEAARAAGIAVVILDPLAPRGLTRREAQLTVCTGLKLRGAERAADLLAALRWLERQPWADPQRVAAAGWSHGGWSIMEALASGPAEGSDTDARVAALKLVVLIYPYAGPLARTRRYGWGDVQPKVFACLAGRDAVVGRVAPRRTLERLQADGLDVRILELSDATHSFDEDQASDPRTVYRPDLAEQVRGIYAQALAEALAPGAGT